mgnify:CR=1 FL=1
MAASILIVEDEYAVARGIEYALQQEGYEVTVASNGEEGLAIVDPVVDYRLPGEVIAGATMDLQEKLLLMAMERAERFTAVTGRAWRIGDVQFGVGSEFDDGTSPKLLRREAALLAGGGEDLLTTSERLLLVAAVTLKVGGAVG